MRVPSHEVEQRLEEALEQQKATAEILSVISGARSDVQPVFETIAAAALRLCKAVSTNVFTFDGELIHLATYVNTNPAYGDELRRLFPRPPNRDLAVTRAMLTGEVVQIPDVSEDPDYMKGTHSRIGGFRSNLAVPLLRDGRPIGAVVVGRPEPGPFPDTQVSLLQTFAEQAVIAIENVRLFNEVQSRNRDLTEALEQQMATSEILRVISQSPTDVQPVFDTIAAAALNLCSASSANVFTYDGTLVHLAALVNLTLAGADAVRSLWPRPLSRELAACRAILTCGVVEIPDVELDADFVPTATAVAGNFRSILSVPLMREGSPIGAIAVGRPEAGTFPENQITLLRTFADQAVIAIENVRLFNELQMRNRELTGALERETATGDVLKVISRSAFDLQPVLDTVIATAARLCGAEHGHVYRYDGELLRFAAGHSTRPEMLDYLREHPVPIGPGSISGTAALRREPVHWHDVLAEQGYQRGEVQRLGGYRTILAVPMLRDDALLGVIVMWKTRVEPFTDKQVELVATFADQAVIAIENVRLFGELELRTKELTRSVDELRALGEVGRAVSSTLDLETVLSTIVSRSTELAGLDGGSIWEYDDAREEFQLHATHGLPAELVDVLRAAPIRKREGALGRLAVTLEPVAIPDIADERSYPARLREVLNRCGYRSVLAVPLLREDQLLGALAVNRSTPGGFTAEVTDLMRTFATQSALAIQNARLFREIEQKSRELETASRHKSEFLANMSHELRTPLNAVIGFSEVLEERLFGPINDKQAEYIRDILESGRHLLSLINDILDLSKIEAGRMELEATDFDLPGTIENALILVRERAGRDGIDLVHEVDPRLGSIHADQRKVKQVLLNLLTNALKFTPDGGRVQVSARAVHGAAEISVADTGIGIAPEDQAAVFEEFRQVGIAAKKVEGTGLGLAISRKFIELHGGRIWLSSEVGVGSTFAFTLPLDGARR